jgi:hypothetical protein
LTGRVPLGSAAGALLAEREDVSAEMLRSGDGNAGANPTRCGTGGAHGERAWCIGGAS